MLADSVGYATLVVLNRLNPAERIAFVLHDLFDIPFKEIARITGRTPELPVNWPAERAGAFAEPPLCLMLTWRNSAIWQRSFSLRCGWAIRRS